MARKNGLMVCGGLPTVMLMMMGLFHAVAAAGTFIPSFVKDRVPRQFEPVSGYLLGFVTGGEPAEGAVRALAVVSQTIIGLSEAVIGLALIGAALMPRRRMALAGFGLSYSFGLFSVFMITMFAMHDPALPKWNQFPAILAWIGVTWIVLVISERLPASTGDTGNEA